MAGSRSVFAGRMAGIVVNMPPNFYSMREKKQILEYIVSENAYNKVKGRTFWVDFSKTGILKRTWQSMKETFAKQLLKDLNNPYYKLTREQKNLFRSGYRSGCDTSLASSSKRSSTSKETKDKRPSKVQKIDADEEFESPPITSTQREIEVAPKKTEIAENVRDAEAKSTGSKQKPDKPETVLLSYDEDNVSCISEIQNCARNSPKTSKNNDSETGISSSEESVVMKSVENAKPVLNSHKKAESAKSTNKKFNTGLFGFSSGRTIVRHNNKSILNTKMKLKDDSVRNKPNIGRIVLDDSDSGDDFYERAEIRHSPKRKKPLLGLYKGKLYELYCGNNEYRRRCYYEKSADDEDANFGNNSKSLTTIRQPEDMLNREINKIFGSDPESSNLYWKLKYFFEKERSNEMYKMMVDHDKCYSPQRKIINPDNINRVPTIKDVQLAETSTEEVFETCQDVINDRKCISNDKNSEKNGNSKLKVEKCLTLEDKNEERNKNFCQIFISKQGQPVVSETVVMDTQNTDILINFLKENQKTMKDNKNAIESVEDKEKEIFDAIAKDSQSKKSPVEDRELFTTLEVEMMLKDIHGELTEEKQPTSKNKEKLDVACVDITNEKSKKSNSTPSKRHLLKTASREENSTPTNNTTKDKSIAETSSKSKTKENIDNKQPPNAKNIKNNSVDDKSKTKENIDNKQPSDAKDVKNDRDKITQEKTLTKNELNKSLTKLLRKSHSNPSTSTSKHNSDELNKSFPESNKRPRATELDNLYIDLKEDIFKNMNTKGRTRSNVLIENRDEGKRTKRSASSDKSSKESSQKRSRTTRSESSRKSTISIASVSRSTSKEKKSIDEMLKPENDDNVFISLTTSSESSLSEYYFSLV